MSLKEEKMKTGKYSLEPINVPKIHTKYRHIHTKLPVPESIPLFNSLMNCEPIAMLTQPPVVWDRAEGFQVYDKWGNKWIDWSSGVLMTNSGHGRKEIRKALKKIIDKPLIASYVFVHEYRVELLKLLQTFAPEPSDYNSILMTTGSEAIECSIKIAKLFASQNFGEHKRYIVSFENSFHGRTLGAQLAGGMPKLKEWVSNERTSFIQVPFPDGYFNKNTSFDTFLESLDKQGIRLEEVAAVLTESYQGAGPDFFPYDYTQQLQSVCKENDILTIFDEVQAGFGRTGRIFAFEHYDVVPDLIVCGKGISSSLPLSAVIGKKNILNVCEIGTMTSTHATSPLPVVASLENLKLLKKEKLVENAHEMGKILLQGLNEIRDNYPSVLRRVEGKGLVAGIHVFKKNEDVLDPHTALKINESCFRKGLLMFAPVGIDGQCIKIAPPLIIEKEPLIEAVNVFKEACDEVLSK